jgi:hypothetical protein
MTVEDLLRPRFIVTAIDTSDRFIIGDIFNYDDEADAFWCRGHVFTEQRLLSYPHLFRKLEWWEDRSPKDMPEYVKRVDMVGFAQ